MPAKRKMIRIDPGPAGDCPPFPSYLEPELRGDWEDVFKHLQQQGTYFGSIDPRLMESWVICLARLRDAHRVIRAEGSFIDGKPHSAVGVVMQASSALAKVAAALGVTGTTRTVLMAAAAERAAKTATTTGAWAQAAAAPTPEPAAPAKRTRRAA